MNWKQQKYNIHVGRKGSAEEGDEELVAVENMTVADRRVASDFNPSTGSDARVTWWIGFPPLLSER